MEKQSVETILGGEKLLGHRIRNDFDFIEISKKGIPTQAATHFMFTFKITQLVMSKMLRVSPRTLQRKRPGERLNPVASERLLETAEAYQRGVEVLGTDEATSKWMAEENVALGGLTPLSLLETHRGTQLVLDVLGRIEWGVFS